MLTLRIKSLLAIIVSIGLLCCQVYGETVFIEAEGEKGQGMACVQNSTCFIITPAHVAIKQIGTTYIPADEIKIIGSRKTTTGRVYIDLNAPERDDIPDKADIAIVTIEDDDKDFCSLEKWPEGEKVLELLNSDMGTQLVKLERMRETGFIEQIQVSIRTYNERFIFIETVKDHDTIRSGWSGSTLRIGPHIVGMLISVESNGVGRVYRQDYLTGIVKPFITAPPLKATSPPIVLGVGALVALGGGITATVLNDHDKNDNPDLFTGTFILEEPLSQTTTGRDQRYIYTLHLSQNGSSVTGTYQKTREIYTCCTLSFTVSVTGSIQGNSGTLSWGPGQDSCRCSDDERISHSIRDYGGTFNVNAVNDGAIIKVDRRGDFVRQEGF